jgi:hypothetical protein
MVDEIKIFPSDRDEFFKFGVYSREKIFCLQRIDNCPASAKKKEYQKGPNRYPSGGPTQGLIAFG